jgi:hypothetical protein
MKTYSYYVVIVITFFLLCSARTIGFAQLHLDFLNLKSKEVYQIVDSDILVVDSLIMGDSSAILLDPTKSESFLHIKWMQIGNACSIIGRGKNGTKGKDGAKGKNGSGPCASGYPGANGTVGSSGRHGANLSWYFTKIIIKGNLIIDISGGDGGDGGSGASGTRACKGGAAGNGGNGGNGGDGGNGGVLKLFCKQCTSHFINYEGNKIAFKMFAGSPGDGGRWGRTGDVGLGVKNGNLGRNGNMGREGKAGLEGKLVVN